MPQPSLFSPIRVRQADIRNRLWVAPMCQYSVERFDGVPTEWHLAHLGSFARGGAGLVMTEATAVSPEGRISPWDTGLWTDTQRNAWEPIAQFVRDQGATAGIQLAHAGRKASVFRPWHPRRGSIPLDEGGWNTVGPSAVPFGSLAAPRPMSRDEITAVVADFAAAARRAVDAGFQLIEVHAAAT